MLRKIGPLLLLSGLFLPAQARDYRFDGTMSEEALRSHLSRSMTLMYLLAGGESALPKRLEEARAKAAKIHAADPEIILQA
jgi:hypothetical protein